MKQFFLFFILSATTFAVAQETYRSLIDFNTQNRSDLKILLINSSRNSSLQQISNNQGKVTFRGILLLMDTKLFLMEPLYLPVKIRFMSAFESSFKCNFGLLKNQTN
jgi:hypothetical protein